METPGAIDEFGRGVSRVTSRLESARQHADLAKQARLVEPLSTNVAAVRTYRNTRLYRSLTRVLRVYNRRLLTQLHGRGFDDFSPAFPPLLSNLDTDGTRIGVLAIRAGVTRQGAGQLLREIERCGYVERRASPHDARSTIVHFTARGRRLLAAIFELVDEAERDFAAVLAAGDFDRLRVGLAQIADRIDPTGALGSVDQGKKKGRG